MTRVVTTCVKRDGLTVVVREFTVRPMTTNRKVTATATEATTATTPRAARRSGGRVVAARLTEKESSMLDELVEATGEGGAVLFRRWLRSNHARLVGDGEPTPKGGA